MRVRAVRVRAVHVLVVHGVARVRVARDRVAHDRVPELDQVAEAARVVVRVGQVLRVDRSLGRMEVALQVRGGNVPSRDDCSVAPVGLTPVIVASELLLESSDELLHGFFDLGRWRLGFLLLVLVFRWGVLDWHCVAFRRILSRFSRLLALTLSFAHSFKLSPAL